MFGDEECEVMCDGECLLRNKIRGNEEKGKVAMTASLARFE